MDTLPFMLADLGEGEPNRPESSLAVCYKQAGSGCDSCARSALDGRWFTTLGEQWECRRRNVPKC